MPQLTSKQFAAIMTILWMIAIAFTCPLTPVLITLALIFGLPASIIFFYNLAEFILTNAHLLEAAFDQHFPILPESEQDD